MTKLARLVEHLGGSVLDVVTTPLGLDVSVSEVLIYDQAHPFEIREGDLVLGIGVTPGEEGIQLVKQLGSARAAALLLKADEPLPDPMVDAAEASGVAIFTVPPAASWTQVVGLLRSLRGHEGLSVQNVELAGVAAGDVFALANAIASLVDAPVIIEDPQLRVIAYSGRQEEADAARTETILGRRVPDRYMRRLEKLGLLDQLYRREGPLEILPLEAEMKPRLAVPIRAGGELLGFMSTVVSPSLSPDKEQAFVEAAKLVALHLLRQRLGNEAKHRLQTDLTAAMLEGRPAAHDAAVRLGLLGDGYRVMAAWVDAEGEVADVEALRNRLWDALAVHLSIFHVQAATTLLGEVIYAVVMTSTDPNYGRKETVRTATEFVTRSASRFPFRTVVGIGGHVESLRDVPRSRFEADQTLQVLRENPSSVSVAEAQDVRTQSLLLRLREMTEEDQLLRASPLVKLRHWDERRGTNYLQTLRVYLDAFGDVQSCTRLLKIHPNTLRYRLRRIEEMTGLRLDNSEERLGVMLELRLIRPEGTKGR